MKKNKNPFKTFSSFYKRTFYKYKTLLKGAFNTGGRNNTGRITVANRGGRQKRKFRNIVWSNLCNWIFFFIFFFFFSINHCFLNFKRITRESDPFKQMTLSLCQEKSWGFLFYKAPLHFSTLFFSEPSFYFISAIFFHQKKKLILNFSYKFGLSFLRTLRLGSQIKNVSIYGFSKFSYGRAVGSFCNLRRHFNQYSVLQLPSKKFVIVYKWNLATPCFLKLNQLLFFTKNIYKAGCSRWYGFKSVVKGRAKNPTDHPHGGKSSPGGVHRTPWGLLTKGLKTLKKKKKLYRKNIYERLSVKRCLKKKK